MMSEHQKETAFLRYVILYDGSEERCKLEQSIAGVQREQRCMQRMASVPALFLLLMAAGVAYESLLGEDFPFSRSEVIFKILCELGLASLICLVTFAGLLTVCRRKLNRLREDCRRLVKRLLESRLGKPHLETMPGSQRVPDDREAFPGAAEESGGQARYSLYTIGEFVD